MSLQHACVRTVCCAPNRSMSNGKLRSKRQPTDRPSRFEPVATGVRLFESSFRSVLFKCGYRGPGRGRTTRCMVCSLKVCGGSNSCIGQGAALPYRNSISMNVSDRFSNDAWLSNRKSLVIYAMPLAPQKGRLACVHH